jgi:tripartite-type tricarboxylate transporter receptor subunit TctC
VTDISRREWLGRAALGAIPLVLGALPRSIRGSDAPAGELGGATAGAGLRAAPCERLAGGSIDWIVPNATGGGYDAYARLVAPHLGRALSSRVGVRNVPGAGGLVGARTLAAAKPDGRTIGIINASGLLAASLAGERRAPNPATDLTLLARICGSRQIWATGGSSPHRSIVDLFEVARTRRLTGGTRDVGSLGFVNLTLTAHLLGLPIAIVPGYEGSGAGALASARGEVDLVAYNFDSVVGHIESGDIRPILQIDNAPVARHPSLVHVPLLGGPDGVAAQRAPALGRDVASMLADVTTVVDLLNAGRLAVGPPRMPPEIAACLEEALLRVLRDPEVTRLAARSQLSLDVGPAAQARDTLRSVAARLHEFIPVIQRAVAELRD